MSAQNTTAHEGRVTEGPESQPQHYEPCDALARIQEERRQPHEYQPITIQRALEITDLLLGYEDDEQVFVFIELLRGIAAAHDGELRRDRTGYTGPDVEDIVVRATHRAYAHAYHCEIAFREFVRLDPRNPRDLRVLRHQWSDEPEGRTEQ